VIATAIPLQALSLASKEIIPPALPPSKYGVQYKGDELYYQKRPYDARRYKDEDRGRRHRNRGSRSYSSS
jgi:hypothetical protein